MIEDAIAEFLPDIYGEGSNGRLTYLKGSTANGAVIYDDVFLYSHHGTDPAGQQLLNAFDLIRIHLFGDLEEGEKTSRSYAATEDFVKELPEVRKRLGRERFSEVTVVFENVEEPEVVEESSTDWMQDLEINNKGEYLSSAHNINTILQNDPYLKGAFKLSEFDGKRYVVKSMPWRSVTGAEPFRNVDYSGVRNYIECIYGISSQLKIDDALNLECERNTWHPVREYLNGLKWDGTERIDSLLPDYFGAVASPYTAEAMRVQLVGAVARIFRPGCKFDYVLVLVDPSQGNGKSTFLRILGREWFSDTFTGVHGKEALEQIQGAWIIEIAELAGLRKAEVEAVKHFITKQQDQFRPAYARTSETFLRQCVFFGTTNNTDFLRDPSGNRRFLPVDVNPSEATKDVFNDLEHEVAQIWAEAVHLFKKGHKLYLSREAESMARIEQELHSENDERVGIIRKYLERKLPKDWNGRDIHERRNFIESEAEGTEQRKYVCAAEVWAECLREEPHRMTRYNTKEINDILRGMRDWQAVLSTKDFGLYGVQRYYQRIG